MNISGIVVTTVPARVPEVAAALAAFPSLGVAQCDVPGGRIVVVQECASVADEVEGLRAIQRLPHVFSADLVVHYFGDEPQPSVASVADGARPPDRCGTDAAPPAVQPDPNSWRAT